MQGLKHLYLVLLGTFMVGFVTGVYVFFLSGGASDPFEEVATPVQLEVIADEYGGCERTSCASYRITEDGDYTFVVRSRGAADARREGELSAGQIDDLLDQVSDQTLARIEATSFTGTCPAAVDGVAYRFQITIPERQYSIDSCTQNISGSPLFTLLIDYFDIFRSTHESET